MRSQNRALIPTVLHQHANVGLCRVRSLTFLWHFYYCYLQSNQSYYSSVSLRHIMCLLKEFICVHGKLGLPLSSLDPCKGMILVFWFLVSGDIDSLTVLGDENCVILPFRTLQFFFCILYIISLTFHYKFSGVLIVTSHRLF